MTDTKKDFMAKMEGAVNTINDLIKKYNLNPKNILVLNCEDGLKLLLNESDVNAAFDNHSISE